ncbi:MAG: dTMP kinase [Beggiatoa sp. IS2]|nr:MAG: dTMP kinase [Beggiatoa sp. IS2]
MKLPAYFITLEGIEGVGKTTQVTFLSDFLRQCPIPHIITREPGGTELGEKLRALLLSDTALCHDSELLLMFAARAEHLHQVIQPALARGEWVVCDRFTDASYAYQGAGRGIAPERIAQLEQWVQADLRPDLTFLLDAPVTTGLQRVQQRHHPGQSDRFEREQQLFFEKVRNGYLKSATLSPHRYRVIDATVSVERVTEQLLTVIMKLLSEP